MTTEVRARARRLLLRPVVLYALMTPLAFSILEMLLRRRTAVQYALDVFDSDLPVLAALRDDWLRYGPSLWDPHLTSGNASLVQLALPPVTPDFLLSFVLPLFVAYFVTYSLLIWSAGVGMHLFLRDSIRLAPAACVVGATIYLFSFWHYIHGFAMPLVPLTLWLTDRWARDAGRRWRPGLALVALGTVQLYAGLVQLVAVIALFQLAYLMITQWRSGRVRRLAAGWLLIWGTCALLFAPVAASLLAYLPGSHRVVWQTGTASQGVLAGALQQTVSLFSTAIVGIPVPGVTTGSAGYAGTFFVGSLALLLLLVGLFRRRDTRGRFVLAMLVVVPLVYFLAIVIGPLQAQLGFLKSFQVVRVSHLFPFVLAANVAFGVDALARGDWRAVARGPVRMAAVAGLLILLGIEAAASVAQWAAPDHTAREATGWLLSAVAIGGGVLAAAILLIHARHSPNAVAIGVPILLLLVVGTVGERAVYARAERFLHGGLGTYKAHMAVDPGFAFIRDQAGSDLERTLTAGSPTNRAAVSGRQEAGGYQSIYPLGYHELFGVLTDPYLQTDDFRRRYFYNWGNRAFPFGPNLRLPIANLMGIRWIWSRNMAFDDPQLVARFQSRDITVYENAAAFPRAFVVGGVRAYPSESALLDGLAAADDQQLRDAAFVLEGEGPPTTAPTAAAADATAEVTSYTPDRVAIRVQTATPAMVVLTDTFASGWTATACGAATSIVRVYAAYRAVAVPSGTCEVTFSYRPLFTYMGFALAGITALALAGFAVVAVRRDREVSPRTVP